MTRKTLADCARCPRLPECDAHIFRGAHKHLKGSDPCELTIESEGHRDEGNGHGPGP